MRWKGLDLNFLEHQKTLKSMNKRRICVKNRAVCTINYETQFTQVTRARIGSGLWGALDRITRCES